MTINPIQPKKQNEVRNQQNEHTSDSGADFTIDDYYELNYQFLKFREKPLIRMASWFDRLIPDGSGIQRVLHKLTNSLSNVKNQVTNPRSQARKGEANRNGTRLKEKIPSFIKNTAPLFPAETSQSLFLRWTNTPPKSPDVLFFTTDDWEQRTGKSNNLIQQLCESGYRVFYIQLCNNAEGAPLLKLVNDSLIQIKFPVYEEIQYGNPVVSDLNVETALNTIKMLKGICLINTAVILLDSPNWRKLASRLKESYGWKIIFDTTGLNTSAPLRGDYPKKNLELTLNQSDLILTDHPTETGLVTLSNQDMILMVNNQAKNAGLIIKETIFNLFPKISIIVITFNNLEYTQKCLDSIERSTEYPNYEIIIVDNASVDGTKDYLTDYASNHQNVKLITNENNTGFAPANNQGARAASGEYLVFLNNDTIVTPGWLYRLYHHLARNPFCGMVGPVTNKIGNEARIQVDYSELKDINEFAAMRSAELDGKTFKIRVLALYCCIISRQLYTRIGGLDERYRIGMFEDDDLALKIEMAGLELLCAEDVFIHHFHGVSFKKFSDEENQRIFHENKLKFETKWGITWQIHKNKD